MKKITLLLSWIFVAAIVNAQNIRISGTVSGKSGPIYGATVIVKGTSTGAITDSSGGYNIPVQKNAILIFSFEGMKTQEIAVEGRSVIHVVLKEKISPILSLPDTCLVLNAKKEALTLPSSTITGTLQGVVAGVQESSSNIVIRGVGSLPARNIRTKKGYNYQVLSDTRPLRIGNGHEPLYVVNGVPMSSVNFLNPQDIEKISILKDASATAIYGARGANGVVIITTQQNASYCVTGQMVNRLPYNEEDEEEYEEFIENKFIMASNEPLSTFSADVDAASYGNMRRFISQGQLPDKNTIRIEELINYFSYDYPQPKDGKPVSITIDAGACPWNTQHRLVRIGIKAKEMAAESLPASNFVFLIDVSGSMHGPTRLDLVKSSLKLLVNNLREKDRVAIVVYAGSAGEVLPSTTGDNKQKIKEALENLTAGGSTAGGAGIKLAYKIAQQNFIKDGNNRVILCTDGDFNVGVSSEKGLEDLIEEERKSGVFLTVLGYGMRNYKDKKMQVLAQKGNGNHAYIDNLQEANKVLVEEFGGSMYTVAKDVKLQIEFNPEKIQAYRLVGYETRLLHKEDFNDDLKDAGEMGTGHTVTALYEVVPAGVQSNFAGSVDELKYQKNERKKTTTTGSPEMLTVKVRYKQPDANTSKKIEHPFIDHENSELSNDFRFAAAVAMFGQLLRKSDYTGEATYKQVIALAESGLGNDASGYRREFVRLVKTVEGIAK